MLADLFVAQSGQNIRKLVKDGLIIRKPVVIHSRWRVRRNAIARRKGRHTGPGKRRGTANARMPVKVSQNIIVMNLDSIGSCIHTVHTLFLVSAVLLFSIFIVLNPSCQLGSLDEKTKSTKKTLEEI